MKEPSLYNRGIEFIKGKISEQAYFDKHQKNAKKISWPEAIEFRKNPILFSKYIMKFRTVGFRRKALSQSMGLNDKHLASLLRSGNSMVTDMLTTSTRNFSSGFVAHYGIIHRVPFSFASSSLIRNEWDFVNFDMLNMIENIIIDGEMLKEELYPRNEWSVNARILERRYQEHLFLRIEHRNDLVIIDLMNPSPNTLEFLSEVLLKSTLHWNYIIYPTVVLGKSILVFVGSSSEKTAQNFIDAEFLGLSGIFKLSTIYGGRR